MSALYVDHMGYILPKRLQSKLPASVQSYLNFTLNNDIDLLNASHNSLYSLCLEVRGVQTLVVIDINYCQIRSALLKANVPSLKELYISNNKLASTLSTLTDLFNQMANLLILNLSNNQFTHLPALIFTGLKKTEAFTTGW